MPCHELPLRTSITFIENPSKFYVLKPLSVYLINWKLGLFLRWILWHYPSGNFWEGWAWCLSAHIQNHCLRLCTFTCEGTPWLICCVIHYCPSWYCIAGSVQTTDSAMFTWLTLISSNLGKYICITCDRQRLTAFKNKKHLIINKKKAHWRNLKG